VGAGAGAGAREDIARACGWESRVGGGVGTHGIRRRSLRGARRRSSCPRCCPRRTGPGRPRCSWGRRGRTWPVLVSSQGGRNRSVKSEREQSSRPERAVGRGAARVRSRSPRGWGADYKASSGAGANGELVTGRWPRFFFVCAHPVGPTMTPDLTSRSDAIDAISPEAFLVAAQSYHGAMTTCNDCDDARAAPSAQGSSVVDDGDDDQQLRVILGAVGNEIEASNERTRGAGRGNARGGISLLRTSPHLLTYRRPVPDLPSCFTETSSFLARI
jgi:hypothetical protein